MHIPAHFEEKDKEEIDKIIGQFPFATIVCFDGDEFVANHIPLMRSDEDEYIGHIAKSNTLHEIFPNGMKAIAIFKAEDSYISPNWYPTKAKTHRHVPTWNYQVVHLHGYMSFLHEKKDKTAIVGRLTKFYEQRFFGKKGWKMSDAPREYIEQLLQDIVGFKFRVERISAKSKISQNRQSVDFTAVQDVMNDLGKATLVYAMENFIAKTQKERDEA